MSARILVYDIETAPNVGLTWGIYDQNVAKVVQQGYVFGFAYKWVGEKKVNSCYVWDFDLYHQEPTNDIVVAKKWLELVNEADIVVGHNSIQFDNKVMTAAVMRHRLDPPRPFTNFDTKTAVKRVAKFDSNKLDDLGERFGIGRKMKHEGIDLWWGCMNNDPKCKRKMVAYNKQDVKLTEDLYLYERPYAISHPPMNIFEGKPDACPSCGEGPLTKQGMRASKTNTYQQYRCVNCGSWTRSRVAELLAQDDRVLYVS